MTHTAPGGPPLELVVETLTPTAAPTVIAVDGHPKAWVPLRNFRNVRNRLVADEVRSVVSTVRESAEPVDRVLPRWRGQRARVLARPVVSFSGAVHAVQLWVGDADTDTPGPAAPVAAIEWSARSHRIELNTQSAGRYDEPPVLTHRRLTAPLALRGVTDIDPLLPFLVKALAPASDDHWDCTASFKRHGQLRTIRMVMRSMPAPHHDACRGLAHDVTATSPAPSTSPLTHTLNTLTNQATRTAAAVLDLNTSRVVTWLTDPMPDIQWVGVVDDRNAAHPDDMVRVFQAYQKVRGGASQIDVPNVRLRRTDGGWTVVNCRGTPLPSPNGVPQLILVEFTPLDTLPPPPVIQRSHGQDMDDSDGRHR